MELNLETQTKEQELIKAYLEENASEMLAEKINNGTPYQQDGKTLINKKTLNGFMKYACDEARKSAEKGANYACIDDKTVFGWAIHYFEEDSIKELLYNEDGTEYKSITTVTKSDKNIYIPTKPAKPKEPSLFDLLDEENEEKVEVEEPAKEKKTEYVDMETGEIFDTVDEGIMSKLEDVFGKTLEVAL